jgi:pyridoxal phosphate enzyme (YggS family)
MISDNVAQLQKKLSLICGRLNQRLDEITLVAVTKAANVEMIKLAIDCGINNIGENRAQEAVLKYNSICTTQYAQRLKWHMVGHLQTNKVKEAVRIFDLIHSVDSLKLAQAINKHSQDLNKIQNILIQVNTSGEVSKFGIKPEETIGLIKQLSNFKNLNMCGLMTIAPVVDNPQKTRPFFKKLRELRDEINVQRNAHNAIHILSMGMTDDFEIAIEEGSNMIRIGRAIFK